MTGEDGIARTRAEKGQGPATGHECSGRSRCRGSPTGRPGQANVHPLDAELNLPEEKHSHGLRKLAAIESARGSSRPRAPRSPARPG